MNRLQFVTNRCCKRVRAFRRDNDGQVLILSGIMVLLAMIMTISAINTGQLIYHRIQSQTAVDAAADSFAAFQARGLNLAQHLNDLHYWANWTIFALESTTFGLRILCPLAGFIPPPYYNLKMVKACCVWLNNTGNGLDYAQSGISGLILRTQAIINRAFPVLGALSANRLAEANGADRISEWAFEVLGQISNMFPNALPEGLNGLADAMPPIDIYVIPLKFGQMSNLNIRERDPNPEHLPWNDQGIIQHLARLSDISCAMVGDTAFSDQLGWEDTYYCGGPSYNTWITGKRRRNVWPELNRLPWLNPDLSAEFEDYDVGIHQDRYPVFDHRGFVAEGGRNEFGNPAFFTIASSQVGGSPLMERSNHRNFQGHARPELISVHIGEPGSDQFVRSVMIWH